MYKVYLAALVFTSLLLVACATEQIEVATPSETAALPTSSSMPPPTAAPASATPVGIPMAGECASVRQIPIEADETEAIAAATVRDLEGAAGQPPPTDIDIGWILQEGEWLLVAGQPNGPGMEGAIFALHKDAGEYRYVDMAWAGQAMSESEIRQSMLTYVPGISPTLVACVDVSGWVVQ